MLSHLQSSCSHRIKCFAIFCTIESASNNEPFHNFITHKWNILTRMPYRWILNLSAMSRSYGSIECAPMYTRFFKLILFQKRKDRENHIEFNVRLKCLFAFFSQNAPESKSKVNAITKGWRVSGWSSLAYRPICVPFAYEWMKNM